MAKNWIITDQGDAINLDFLASVKWGGNFKAPTSDQTKMVYFYHGISNDSSSKGSATVYAYPTANLAEASANKVNNLLVQLGAATDLGPCPVTILASDTPTTPAGAAVIITLTGTAFSNSGKVTINAVDMPAGCGPGGTTLKFVLDTTLTAGTYNVEYTDPSGNAAVLVNGITLT